jgi:hypothetical protein
MSMRSCLLVRPVLAGALLALSGCGSTEPVAPNPSESINVIVGPTRLQAPGESVPIVSVAGGVNGVTLRVTTGGTCLMLVRAGVSRTLGTLDVVSHVSPNPAADCAAIYRGPEVFEYQAAIGQVVEGAYRVRVFQGANDEAPRLIGSAAVIVTRP